MGQIRYAIEIIGPYPAGGLRQRNRRGEPYTAWIQTLRDALKIMRSGDKACRVVILSPRELPDSSPGAGGVAEST